MNPQVEERLSTIILGPHGSEKSAKLTESQNQVVFKVRTDANKKEIRAAVEQLFEVSVTDVNVVNVRGKIRRTKNGYGKRNNWKKAYVSLAEGSSIDLMGNE